MSRPTPHFPSDEDELQSALAEEPEVSEAVEDAPEKWYMEFNAFAVCDSLEEANLLSDDVFQAVEEVLCGRNLTSINSEGEHVCGRSWSAGGKISRAEGYDWDEDE